MVLISQSALSCPPIHLTKVESAQETINRMDRITRMTQGFRFYYVTIQGKEDNGRGGGGQEWMTINYCFVVVQRCDKDDYSGERTQMRRGGRWRWLAIHRGTWSDVEFSVGDHC